MEELLGTKVSKFDLVPIGRYSGVIVAAEVLKGPKGPYIKVEVKIHDEGFRGRSVWRGAASFSEKAKTMPGAAPNLVQATQPEIDPSIEDVRELPAAIADALISLPVGVEVEHEQIKRNGELALGPDGEPELRATIKEFFEVGDDFRATIEAEIEGVDDDLPF
jgi:hypothetical protein